MPPQAREQLKRGISRPQSSEEYLKTRRDWANAEVGRLKGVDCPLCKNRGYTTEIQGNYLISVECPCMETRRSIKQIERSGMKGLLENHTFANFKTAESWQAQMKKKALSFLGNESGAWFAALGSVGAGKTHICTAICGELLKRGCGVRYMLWRDESTKIKAVVNDAKEYGKLLDPYKTAQVLYIDDLFKTKRGEEIRAADINLAFELLNYRYCDKRLVTIISSEKTMDELMNIDEAIGSRIYERCGDYCVEISGNKNRRIDR